MARWRHTTLFTLIVLSILTWALWSLPSSQRSPGRELGSQTAGKHQYEAVSRHLVVAAMSGDDTSWIARRLPEWSSTIYTADDPLALPKLPRNKGREAMVYLTYIVDHYDRLPPISVFIHADQYQWHNDDPNYDSATVLSRLQIPHVLSRGYANLRCAWELGCPSEIHVKQAFSHSIAEAHYSAAFQQLFPGHEIPELVGAACCAQFAASREQIRKVSLGDWKRVRQWLLDTELEDAISGRIMEYSWHILLGREPVHCPEARTCYCEVFGLCKLDKCTHDACDGRYFLPPQSDRPGWWKEDPALVGGEKRGMGGERGRDGVYR